MTAESGLVFVAGRYLDLLRERDTLAAEVEQLEQLRAQVAELREEVPHHYESAVTGRCVKCGGEWQCQPSIDEDVAAYEARGGLCAGACEACGTTADGVSS